MGCSGRTLPGRILGYRASRGGPSRRLLENLYTGAGRSGDQPYKLQTDARAFGRLPVLSLRRQRRTAAAEVAGDRPVADTPVGRTLDYRSVSAAVRRSPPRVRSSRHLRRVTTGRHSLKNLAVARPRCCLRASSYQSRHSGNGKRLSQRRRRRV